MEEKEEKKVERSPKMENANPCGLEWGTASLGRVSG